MRLRGQDATPEWKRANCRYCKGEGKVLYHGAGAFAELRSCPTCGSGKKLADTIIPNVRELESDGPGAA